MSVLDPIQADLLLSTTRAVRRRLDFDRPVAREVVMECLRVAVQAPTGSNQQGWRWLFVDDAATKHAVAELYRAAGGPYFELAKEAGTGDAQSDRVIDSAIYLSENLERVPLWLIPCLAGRLDSAAPVQSASFWGSILPAVWSFQLALRARGLGSTYTTLHLAHERRCGEILGIPRQVTQAGLVPIAYTKGQDFRPARRPPVENITYWNRWKATDPSHGSGSPGPTSGRPDSPGTD